MLRNTNKVIKRKLREFIFDVFCEILEVDDADTCVQPRVVEKSEFQRQIEDLYTLEQLFQSLFNKEKKNLSQWQHKNLLNS